MILICLFKEHGIQIVKRKLNAIAVALEIEAGAVAQNQSLLEGENPLTFPTRLNTFK